MPRLTLADRERAELCRVPGCGRRWFTTFSRIGPVCQKHLPQDAPEPTQQIPTTPPAKAWSEPEQRDE
jgi:hypothetical protein